MTDPLLLPLPDLSLWTAEGPDAQSFLQGQLSADLLGLERRPGQLAAACTAQGRVTEILRLAQWGSRILLMLPADLADGFIARLEKHRLRARLSFRPVIDGLRACGVLGRNAGCPPLQQELLRFHLGPTRQVILAAAQVQLAGQATAAWQLAGLRDGEPTLSAATRERWIPQMLNLDLLQALNFSKGCYVGQEIVARTQHLGRIKRRMFRYQGTGPLPLAGDTLFRGQEPVGEVVCAAGDAAASELLAVVGIEHAGVPLGRSTAAADWHPAPLPYEIPLITTGALAS